MTIDYRELERLFREEKDIGKIRAGIEAFRPPGFPFLKPQPIEPIKRILTPEEIAKLDLEVPEGWEVEIEQVGEEFKLNYKTPDKWTLKWDGSQIDPMGKVYTPEQVKEQKELIDHLGKVFPDKDIRELMSWAETNPEKFVKAFRDIGDTPETRAILKRIGIGDEDIKRIYPPVAPPVIKEIPWWKVAKAYLTVGLGQLLHSGAETIDWIGSKLGIKMPEVVVRNLKDIGSDLINTVLPKAKPEEMTWRNFVDPDWWTTSVSEAAPMSLGLVIPGILSYISAAKVAGRVGLGPLGKIIVSSVAGGGIMRTLEGAMEASDVEAQMLRMGASEAEARKASDQVFKQNMYLAGLDAASLALMFVPIKGWLAAGGIKGATTLWRLRLAALPIRVFALGIMEAGEEAFQERVTLTALRQPLPGWEELTEAKALGFVLGAGLGGPASIVDVLTGRIKQDLPSDLLARFNELKKDAIDAGLTEQQAELQAFDTIAETTRGRASIERTMEDIKSKIAELKPEIKEPNPFMKIPESEDIIKSVMADTWMRQAVQLMAKFPPARKLIEWGLGTRVLVKRQSDAIEDIVGRGKFLHSEIIRKGEAAQAVAYWRLANISLNPIELFGFRKRMKSKAGITYEAPISETIPRLVKEADGTMEDIFTHPNRYGLTKKQKQYVLRVKELNDSILAMLKNEGINPDIVGHDWWMHRVVEGKFDPDGELIKVRGRPGVRRGRIGAKASFEMHRKAPTMMDGITWGILYGRNPAESVATYIEEAFKKIADTRFEKYMAEQLEPLAQIGVLPREELLRRYPEVVERAIITAEELADVNNFIDKINRAIRGEKLPKGTLNAIERRFPELGKKFRAIVEEPIIAEKQLRELLAQNERIIKNLTARLEKVKKVDVARLKAEITASVRAEMEAEARAKKPDDIILKEAFQLMEYDDRVAFRAAMESRLQEVQQAIFEHTAEIEVTEEFLRTDPIATYRGKVGKKTLSLMGLVKKGQLPESFTVLEAEMLLMGKKPKTIIKGRVPIAYVLDELADHFKITETELIRRIEAIYHQRQTLEDIKRLLGFAEESEKHIKWMLEILDSVDVLPQFVPFAEPVPPVAPTPPAAPLIIEAEVYVPKGAEIGKYQAWQLASKDVANYFFTYEGQSVKGKPIKIEDLPDKLYHVTTNKSAIQESGKIIGIPGGNKGLGGLASDRLVSLTSDKSIALQIKDDLLLAIQVAKRSKEEAYKILQETAKEQGFAFKLVPLQIKSYGTKDYLNHFFSQREEKAKIRNPLLVSPLETYKNLQPQEVDIIEVDKKQLNPKALITDFDSTNPFGLKEIRVHGEIILREPELRIPEAIPGMPEPGIQTDMFGYSKPVYPKGKGVPTQISMEEYNRLMEMRKEAGLTGEPPNISVKPKIEGVEELEAETTFQKVEFEVPPVKDPKARIKALKDLREEVKALKEIRRIDFHEARRERAFRMEQVRQPGIGDGYIMHPFAQGRKYDQEFIDAFNKFFGHEAGLPSMNITADIAGMLRILKATLDFSQPVIQGTLSWGLAHSYLLTNPPIGIKLMTAWYRMFFEQIGAFFNPGITAKFMEANKEAAMERIAHGGSARAVFLFQEMAATVGKGKIAEWGEKGLRMIPLQPYQRAEIAFFTGGEIVRDRFWRILSPTAIAKGQGAELARFLDLMTGIADPRAMGVPLSIRQLEQSWIFFSSAYTRSYLTIIAEIFRGGFTGAQARAAISGFIVAGVAFLMGIQYAMSTLRGKDDEEAWEDVAGTLGLHYDPILKKWEWRPSSAMMAIKIGDTYYGIGGGIYGLMRLAGNIAATIQEIGDREVIDFVRIIKHGSLNKRDNPFINWWYNRSSALFGAVHQMAIEHRDFLGYPIEGVDGYIKHIARLLMPIWVESTVNRLFPKMLGDRYIPEQTIAETIAASGAEIFGLRVIPEYAWQKFHNKAKEFIPLIPEDMLDEKQKQAFRAGKLRWEHLTEIQQWYLLGKYPDLAKLYKDAETDSDMRAQPHWKAWEGRQEEERNIYYKRGQSLVERVVKGELNTRELRKMWSEAGQNYGIALKMIEKEPAYKAVYDYFDKQREKGDKYLLEANLALAEYIQIMFAEYVDEKGDIDWRAKDKAIDDFIKKWGVDYYNTIREMYATKRLLEGMDPLLIKLSDDKDKLGREYWRLPYIPIKDMDKTDEAKGNIPAEFYALWKHYQTLKTKEEREAFLEDNPDLAKDWRADFRRANPEADAILAFWGYGGKLQSKQAYDLVVKWSREFNIPIAQMALGLPPENLIEQYFKYNEIVSKFGANSAEAKLYRLENPEWDIWGKQPENMGWLDIETPIQSLRISVKWRDLDKLYASYGDRESVNFIETREGREAARDKLLKDNPEYAKDRRRRDAYEIKGFPEALIETYVKWFTVPRKGYEDDWFLMENKEFYEAMVELGQMKARDFSKVPTKEVWALYQLYLELPAGKARYDFRGRHPELDAWGVITKKWKPWKPPKRLTKKEEEAEEKQRQAEIEKQKAWMREWLKRLR